MARRPMRDPSGRWSLNQVAAAAGITRQTARTIAANGYLGDQTNLGHKDIVLARVAAHLLDAPRPTGSKERVADALTKRNFDALGLTRRVVEDPTPAKDTTLLVTAEQVALHESPFKLMAAIEDTTTATLLLPVGAWVLDVRDDLNDLRASA